jgi:hypothetical protein
VDTAQEAGFRPPYLAFQTFWSFLTELTALPLPGKLDRSVMRKKSGSDQAHLAVALKSFDLIDEAWNVTGLKNLVMTDEAARAAWLEAQVRKHYADQMEVSDDNGTEQQLRDSFKKSFGLESADTVRKAMTFFLHAARKAEIETSQRFPSTRSGSGAPGASKPRRSSTPKRKPADTAKDKDGGGSGSGGGLTVVGDVYTLTMDSGPVVTLAVKINVMEASIYDREFIFEVVDKLRAYGNGKSSEPSGSEPVAGSAEEDQ